MFAAALAAAPITRAALRLPREASAPTVRETMRAYRDCITELCALAHISGIEGLALLGSSLDGALSARFYFEPKRS